MSFDWIVLVPPVVVLISAAATRHVIASLFAGILTATAIHAYSAVISPFAYVLKAFMTIITNPDKITLFAFLAILGTVVELMTRSGGVAAYTAALSKRFVGNKRQTENASLITSCVFFLDDYLNSLTTGAIMRPLTDRFAVPRVKLAYLINSMSSPLAPLIPLSSWAAAIILCLQTGGVSDHGVAGTLINADPLIIYLTAIPFMFYAIFIIITAFVVVNCNISFGAMQRQELIAEESGNLFGGKSTPSTKADTQPNGTLADFFVPIGSFIASALFFLLYTGHSRLLGGSNSFMQTLRSTDTMVCLLSASLFTLVVICIMSTLRHTFSIKKIGVAAVDGILSMRNSLTVLLLAFTFGNMINYDLQSGAYLASLISSSLPQAILPLIIFLLATITTASTGSSWGTMTILIPFTVTTLAGLATGAAPLAASAVPLLFPSLGALIAGSVAGAHFSPITDATVVSSMSAGAYHLDHVKTMIAYAFPALMGSCLSFLIVGLTPHWGTVASYFTAFGAGIVLTIIILFIRNAMGKEKR